MIKLKKLVAVLLLLTWCLPAFADEFTLSTGPKGLPWHVMGNEVVKVCSKLEMTNADSPGTPNNMSLLTSSPTVRYAMGTWDGAVYSEAKIKGMKNVVLLLPLHDNLIYLAVREGAGIKNVRDLAGKRVSIGAFNSGSWVTGNMIKRLLKIQWVESNLGLKEVKAKMEKGELDAAIISAGKPVPDFQSWGKDVQGVIKLISVDDPALDDFYGKKKADIPAGLYPWQKDAVETYPIKNGLFTYNYQTPALKKEAEELVTCILEGLPTLQGEGSPPWRDVDPTDRSMNWRMSPIAEKVIADWVKKHPQ